MPIAAPCADPHPVHALDQTPLDIGMRGSSVRHPPDDGTAAHTLTLLARASRPRIL